MHIIFIPKYNDFTIGWGDSSVLSVTTIPSYGGGGVWGRSGGGGDTHRRCGGGGRGGGFLVDNHGGELVTMAGGGGLGGGGPRSAGVLYSLSNSDVKGGRAIGSSLVIRRPTSLTVRRPCPSVSTVTRPLKLVLTKEFPSSKKKEPLDSGIQVCLRSCCGGGGGGGGGERPLVRTGCNVVR